MAPPFSSNVNLDLEALSGICGSISIACWVVVFSPQIIENFRRRSAEGLSVAFIVIWLAGDVFNILGAVMQGVLPTMVILAVYYTIADVVLLGQVWWYKGFTLRDDEAAKKPVVVRGSGGAVGDSDEESESESASERQPLFRRSNGSHGAGGDLGDGERRGSFASLRRHLSLVDGAHLSPATPLLDERKPNKLGTVARKPQTTMQTVLFNSFAILMVCAAGVLGWWVSARSTSHKEHQHEDDDFRGELPEFDTLGQIFGYLCAVLYLGSRVPQLLLNYRRKSTEGVSLLFFLFACIGNLTYDMSIFAFNPAPYCENGPKDCLDGEKGAIYGRYIAVNASWIAGSLGTLFLDMAIFVQFFLYRKDDEEGSDWVGSDGYGSSSRGEDRI